MRDIQHSIFVAVPLALCLGLASSAQAATITISIGVLSFDEFVQADPLDPTAVGTNAFNVLNDTGPGAVVSVPFASSQLVFSSMVLTPYDEFGVALPSLPLPDLVAGYLHDPGVPLVGLQASSVVSFTRAELTGNIDLGTFLLSDLTSFTPDSLSFAATLLPSPGNVFLAPFDFAVIELTGDAATAAVPEPSTLLLLGGGLSLLGRYRRRRRAPGRGVVVNGAAARQLRRA